MDEHVSCDNPHDRFLLGLLARLMDLERDAATRTELDALKAQVAGMRRTLRSLKGAVDDAQRQAHHDIAPAGQGGEHAALRIQVTLPTPLDPPTRDKVLDGIAGHVGPTEEMFYAVRDGWIGVFIRRRATAPQGQSEFDTAQWRRIAWDVFGAAMGADARRRVQTKFVYVGAFPVTQYPVPGAV